MLGITDIYSFATGTAFQAALAIFVLGAVYRLARFLFFWRHPVKAEPRDRGAWARLIGLIRTFLDPIIEGFKDQPLESIVGLIALHILGVIPLIFLMDHHIAAFNDMLPKVAGYGYAVLKPISVPLSSTDAILHVNEGLPLHTIWGPLVIVLNGDVLAILALIGVGYKLGAKAVERLHGMQHVRIGDFLALILLGLILYYGFATAHHLPGTVSGYRDSLGIHILLADVLLAVLPFTKFWHFVFGYWYGKLHEWYDLRIQKGLV